MQQLAPDECQIVLALGRKLENWDLVVSFFDASTNRWIARRCDIDLVATGRTRDLALQQVKNGRRRSRPGRPVENKLRYETRLDRPTIGLLDELAKHTGVSKSALITLLITKAYAAWKNMSLADEAAKKFNDQQRLYLIGAAEANIGLVYKEDLAILELLNLEEAAEEKLESFDTTYFDVCETQREDLLLIDRIQKWTASKKYSVRFFLDCAECGYQDRIAKAKRSREQLLACDGHHTSMVYNSRYLPTRQRIRHCFECGMVTGPWEHPAYRTCAEHIAAGITENYFK